MSDTPHSQRTRSPGKSRIVGPARQLNGTTTMAYRAVIAHVCGACGAEIAPDALFSRRTIQRAQTLATSLAQMPVCTTCRPLRVEGDGDRTGETDGAGSSGDWSVTVGEGDTQTGGIRE